MGRRFYDLCVSTEALPQAFNALSELGFKGVGASLSVRSLRGNPSHALDALRELKRRGEAEGLDVVSRLTVDVGMDEASLKSLLRKFRRRVEVVSVQALDRRMTALACRDTRVDLISLLPGSQLAKGDLDYVIRYGKRIEILMAPLQSGDPLSRARALSYYSGVIKLLHGKKLTHLLILSSGASDTKALRDPRSMASLLSVMGLAYEAALDAVSVNVELLVSECRDKLAGIIPVRGVRIVKGGGTP